MIIIRYSEWGPQLEAWQEKLEELVAPHRFEAEPSLTQPELKENGRAWSGPPAINAFLKQLEKDIIDWRAPGCGV